MADTDAATGIEDADASQLASIVGQMSDEDIAQMMQGEARAQVLEQIFGRMAEHVEPEQAKGTDTVVHFKILDRPEELGGGYDHYEVVLKDGRAEVSDKPQAEPKVTIKVDPVSFLRLVTGAASGPTLFMTGKLKLEGDLMLASRLTGFFRIPSAA